MIQVPSKFQPKHPIRYPEDNVHEFERWFFDNWTPADVRCRTYLPILWTGYFCKHRYGKDHGARLQLERYLRTLDKSRQYYSIVQFDSGPLVKLPPNLKIMAMSGPVRHYPLPLICQPHEYQFDHTERTIFANFLGAETHSIRKKLIQTLQHKPEYMISSGRRSLKDFCHLLSQSIFTLCPRGFGETSFRIQEALQYGSIPVYISDVHIIPHNKEFNYGVLVHSKDVDQIDAILKSIPQNKVKQMQENGRKAYKEMFTYEGCKRLILENVKGLC